MTSDTGQMRLIFLFANTLNPGDKNTACYKGPHQRCTWEQSKQSRANFVASRESGLLVLMLGSDQFVGIIPWSGRKAEAHFSVINTHCAWSSWLGSLLGLGDLGLETGQEGELVVRLFQVLLIFTTYQGTNYIGSYFQDLYHGMSANDLLGCGNSS